MIFFELQARDISELNDADLRELVGRLCEAELLQSGIPPSRVFWGGAQEAPDGASTYKSKPPTESMILPIFHGPPQAFK